MPAPKIRNLTRNRDWGFADILVAIRDAERGCGPRILGRGASTGFWIPIGGVRRLEGRTEARSLADGTWFPLVEIKEL